MKLHLRVLLFVVLFSQCSVSWSYFIQVQGSHYNELLNQKDDDPNTSYQLGTSATISQNYNDNSFVYASVNLEQGSLKASAVGAETSLNMGLPCYTVADICGDASASAYLSETLTFSGTGLVTFIMDVSGSGLLASGSAGLHVNSALGSADDITNFGADAFAIKDTLTVDALITEDFSTIQIVSSLLVNAYPFGEVDFANSAYLSISMPEGMSYESNSGVFLSNPAIRNIPEPSTIVLMSFFFAVIALTRKRSIPINFH